MKLIHMSIILCLLDLYDLKHSIRRNNTNISYSANHTKLSSINSTTTPSVLKPIKKIERKNEIKQSNKFGCIDNSTCGFGYCNEITFSCICDSGYASLGDNEEKYCNHQLKSKTIAFLISIIAGFGLEQSYMGNSTKAYLKFGLFGMFLFTLLCYYLFFDKIVKLFRWSDLFFLIWFWFILSLNLFFWVFDAMMILLGKCTDDKGFPLA